MRRHKPFSKQAIPPVSFQVFAVYILRLARLGTGIIIHGNVRGLPVAMLSEILGEDYTAETILIDGIDTRHSLNGRQRQFNIAVLMQHQVAGYLN